MFMRRDPTRMESAGQESAQQVVTRAQEGRGRRYNWYIAAAVVYARFAGLVCSRRRADTRQPNGAAVCARLEPQYLIAQTRTAPDGSPSASIAISVTDDP